MSRVSAIILLSVVAAPALANDDPPGDPTSGYQIPYCNAITPWQALYLKAQLVSPLSTARATTRRPTFRWDSCAGARVQVCADRSCAQVLQTADVLGADEWTPPSDLTGNGNVYFWRVTNLVGGEVGATSRVWEVVVPEVSAASSTSGGSALDYDLDGLADFAVGAYDATPTRGIESGAVYVYHGTGRSPGISVQTLTQPVPQEKALFGATLSNAGDINGDGFGDLVVGANNAVDGNGDGTGAAYVFFGGASGFDPTPSSLFGTEASAFGYSVSGAGDVDGDGFGDLLVGAPAYGGGTGQAYLFSGRPGTRPKLTGSVTVLEGSGGAVTEFGVNVAGVGDLNGDGFADIAVGESYFQFWTGNYPAGKVFVWYGSEDGPKGPVELVSPDTGNGDGFGFTISEAGDLDHDGYHDLVVGASGTDGGDGAVYVWYGGPSGLAAGAPDLALYPANPAQGYFGHAVSVAGDIDGDGTDDLVVGETDVASYAGGLQVFLSSGTKPVAVASPDSSFDYFGGQLAIFGDADGDGLAEFVAGADGAAWLFPSTGAPPNANDAITLGPVTAGFGNVGR